VLVLQIPRQLFLVDLLHLVSLTKLLPLELVDVDLVVASEELFCHVKASLLRRFKRLETHIAES
jgi:hypothetical protein